MKLQRIGLIGYGEVGRTFSIGLKDKPGVTSSGVWDLKFADPATRNAELDHASLHGVTAHGSMRELCEASDLIISAVTASNTLAVAQEAAQFIRAGSVFLDFNSASPGTKQQAAAAIDVRGADYVEAGVMTSVPPYGIRVPMLLGGAQAAALAAALAQWGLDATAVSDKLGVASAIKMCRSVMIKGLEALVIESYATARKYGVEAHVLPTLQETFPSIDWQQQGGYFTASAAPKKCAKPRTPCARPASSRSWQAPPPTSSSGSPTGRAMASSRACPRTPAGRITLIG
jgi:3-hydroxyisobutyrate dehydrogenase-like beta-hydroxyacid dehydrogenase